METVECDSKAAGCMRKMLVYTPPGYFREQHYPVLYLLHGSLADETGWVKDGRAELIFDNLSPDKRAVPMIVVMPNGNLPSTAESASFGPRTISLEPESAGRG